MTRHLMLVASSLLLLSCGEQQGEPAPKSQNASAAVSPQGMPSSLEGSFIQIDGGPRITPRSSVDTRVDNILASDFFYEAHGDTASFGYTVPGGHGRFITALISVKDKRAALSASANQAKLHFVKRDGNRIHATLSGYVMSSLKDEPEHSFDNCPVVIDFLSASPSSQSDAEAEEDDLEYWDEDE